MSEGPALPGTALSHLVDASHLSGADDLPRLIEESARQLGASGSTLYLTDYDLTVLQPLQAPQAGTDEAPAGDEEQLSIDGTVAGRAFRDVATLVMSAPPVTTLWVPVLDGTDRLGVLRLDFAGPVDDALVEAVKTFASVVAELVITRGFYGDRIQLTRRRLPMTLPAELQWNLLPPLTFATPRVTVSGHLLPTHEIAGDSFDYALNGDILHVAIVDAMGHGMEAALISTVGIAALRNARRCGLDLSDTARSIDRHISAQFATDVFLTAIVAELDCSTGRLRWLTAGHPPALLLRRNQMVKQLDSGLHPPLGLLGRDLTVAEEQLEPGDRLLFFTDGVVEARDLQGRFFGVTRLADLATRGAQDELPLPETVRRLTQSVMAHQDGNLTDDATTLLVEWAGGGHRDFAF